MPTVPFDEVWKRILSHQAEVFYTETGIWFTYLVIQQEVEVSQPKFGPLSKDNFQKGYSGLPASGPGFLPKNVMGPSYVWGILTDTRITHREW
jgi:hypothetical protein